MERGHQHSKCRELTELPSPYFQILICNVIKEQKYLKLNCPTNDRNHQGKKISTPQLSLLWGELAWPQEGIPHRMSPPRGQPYMWLDASQEAHLGIEINPYPFPSQMPLRHKDPVVQLLNHVLLFVTQWTAACQASLSFTVSRSLLKLMSIESVMSSNHLILCHSLLLLPSIFPSISLFQ